ncbi:MAG: radical SAM protein [Gammaproteobacteria bacterium]|nr:radical SAM protein [Gammaproteobacteria bacterium]MCP5426078.1 radical SAM protein [Gammaproteobacteria bacterium]
MNSAQPYQGVEQGPIRPPSEAHSLCLRITRNCNWNRCTFCPVFKDKRFTLRPVEDVIQDIDILYGHTQTLRGLVKDDGDLELAEVRQIAARLPDTEQLGFRVALHWFASGMTAVFLQDANSLIVKPPNLLAILTHLKGCFPSVRRVTSYARSQNVARMHETDLEALRHAGLNRLHIGFESGADSVLSRIKKGATQAIQIMAGSKVKAAGIELSEYYMPGLGGQELSREHALESAAALNQINPDFIRLRSLAIPPDTPLDEDYRAGLFKRCGDLQIVAEIRLFVEHLQGIGSQLVSDHFLNLLPQVEGRLPDAKPAILGVLDRFLATDPERQRLYQIGKRMDVIGDPEWLNDPVVLGGLRKVCHELGVTADNADDIAHALLLKKGL